MTKYQPEPCTEDQFIDAQITHNALGWTRAGNGESFKYALAEGYQNYVRTGKRYWAFESMALLNHAELGFRVRSATVQEQEGTVEGM